MKAAPTKVLEDLGVLVDAAGEQDQAALLSDLLAPVDAGMQAGRSHIARAVGRPPKALDTSTIIRRMRVSYPALRATKVDHVLRQLMLSELVTQVFNEGGSVILPQGMKVQLVSHDNFTAYREALSGLTDDNAPSVQSKLMEAGLAAGMPSFASPGA